MRSVQAIRTRLLRWYGAKKRDLPWRRTKDPYRIWISEVMLQQTRVDTVIPYYERFIGAFPDVRSLARAKEERVLKNWEGLGYYSRARNLLAAAREVVADYGGKLPDTAERLKDLPGFGPYTSAAVASIAFGEPAATVDGNVRRVISRLFARNQGIEDLAQGLVDPKNPSAFNQAMMELGALICLPRNPKCVVCPVRSDCRAFGLGRIAVFPPIKNRLQPKDVYSIAAVVTGPKHVLLVKRASIGRFGGLWEFPTFESARRHDPLKLARAELRKKFGVNCRSGRWIGSFKHQLSHRTIHMDVVRLSLRDPAVLQKGRWVGLRSWRKLPFSRLQLLVADLAHIDPVL